MRECHPPASLSGSIFLEYGADSEETQIDLEIGKHGAHFHCRWHFEIGTQLRLSVSGPETGRAICLEGVVVESLKTAPSSYRTAIFFAELQKKEVQDLLLHPTYRDALHQNPSPQQA